MAILFSNFAYSTLATAINNSQTSLTVAAGHGARFPSPSGGDYFYATLESALLVREIVKVTARSTDTLTIVRAQDNTSASAFSAGVSVALRLNAAAITGAGVADTVRVYTKNQSVLPVTLTPGANIATDASLSNVFKITLDQNSTLDNPTNLTDGMNLEWLVYQDGTGGWTLAYGSKFEWLTGSAPTITATASARNVVSGVYDIDVDKILCVWQGQ